MYSSKKTAIPRKQPDKTPAFRVFYRAHITSSRKHSSSSRRAARDPQSAAAGSRQRTHGVAPGVRKHLVHRPHNGLHGAAAAQRGGQGGGGPGAGLGRRRRRRLLQLLRAARGEGQVAPATARSPGRAQTAADATRGRGQQQPRHQEAGQAAAAGQVDQQLAHGRGQRAHAGRPGVQQVRPGE